MRTRGNIFRMNIGIFSEGAGGLMVLKECTAAFPQFHYVYVGARETRQAFDFLCKEKCCGLVICADEAEDVQENVLSLMQPLAQKAVEVSAKKRLGLMTTKQPTAYAQELAKLDPTLHITQQATPLLIPLMEEGRAHKPETNMMLKRHLRPLKHAGIDTLILGAPSFSILEKDMRRILGKKVQILACASVVRTALERYLLDHPDLEAQLSKVGGVEYYTTEDPERFAEVGKRVFHGNIGKVQQVGFEGA